MNHLFIIQENDTVVAETADEAFALWSKETGYTLADLDEGMDDIVQIDDARTIKVHTEPNGEIAEHGSRTATPTAKTAAEWAAGNEKGILFSYEY